MKETGPQETRSQVAFVEFWGAKRHLDTSTRGEKAAWVSGQGGGGEPSTFHFPWSRTLAVGMAGKDGRVSQQGLQIEKVTGPEGKVSLLHTRDP